MLELHGAVVTIDAMGCQRTIAAQIIDQNADYAAAQHKDVAIVGARGDAASGAWKRPCGCDR